ncbi:mechanosensitive ion channel family protein [Sphingorhabdus arenilitoris]|uniref:Mechanosensitive ion channel family protein n=1 Tax=Sphingorhabdus arenilitoris TaxID=1490041 RepID=A0ABV8RKY7_9SPHN
MTNRPQDIVDPVDLTMLERLRINFSGNMDFTELGIAAAIILFAAVIGLLIGRIIAARFTRFADGEGDDDWHQRFHPLLKATSAIMRHAVTAILLMIAQNSWNWQFHSEMLLGAALALALALSAYRLLRALSLGFWTAMPAATALFAFVFSQSVGGLTPLSSLLDKASFTVGSHRFSLLTLVTASLIAIFLIALVRLGNRGARLALRRNKGLDDGQRLLGEKLAMVALVVAAFFIGIDMLGIDLTALAVFSGAIGLAIGFGLQKTVGNLIAGIILLWDRSIKPGDVIVVGDSFGWVNKIGIRAVSVLTRDGKEHLIPNENLMTNEVENWSYSSKNVRVKIPVGVSYSSDMKLVEELMIKAAVACPRVLKRPAPMVWMTGFGDSSVDFEIQAWIRDPEEGVGNVRSAVLKEVWWLFKEHEIEIPFPQRDVNFRNLPPGYAAGGEQAAPPKAAAKAKPRKTKTESTELK